MLLAGIALVLWMELFNTFDNNTCVNVDGKWQGHNKVTIVMLIYFDVPQTQRTLACNIEHHLYIIYNWDDVQIACQPVYLKLYVKLVYI